MNLLSVMMSVQGLLESPEPDNALDNVVAVQYRRKPEVFNLTAKNWTHAYADGMRFNVSVCLSVCLLSSTRSNSVHTTSETCRRGKNSNNSSNNNNEILSKSRRKVQPGPPPQRPATCAKAEQAKEKEADNLLPHFLSRKPPPSRKH